MAVRLHISGDGFQLAFQRLLERGEADSGGLKDAVSAIIQSVRQEGFEALQRFTLEFDRFDLTPDNFRISNAQIDAAAAACSKAELSALEFAAQRIRDYHERQLPADCLYEDNTGVTLGWRWTPVGGAGLYAPGGLAAYPSSVLMNAIPAKVAGVERIVLVTPARGGAVKDIVLAAAKVAGVDEIYRIGGAQAVAALAFGAGPIAPVDMIAGPGNAYVAEAKRQVFGQVGIDNIAGPSEILVIADGSCAPEWIAADLLSQAEHDPSSQSILITDDLAFADKIGDAVSTQLKESERGEIASAAWENNGAIIVINDLDQAPPLINAIAPEHLELAVSDPDPLLRDVKNAGAIFLGSMTPEAIGDYVAGPNHVLPTSRTARFASGLSVLDFMKRTSIMGCSPAALGAIGPPAVLLAQAEGLPGHARSVELRMSRKKRDN